MDDHGGVSLGTRLPPGRHGIAPELVIANQRQRLLAAAALLVAEQGYTSLSVGKIAARACVSRATFYRLFDSKLDCVMAAHQTAFERLNGTLLDSCASQRYWPDGVARAVTAALDLAAESPAEAQLLAFTPIADEPQWARLSLGVNERLLGLLRAGREGCSKAAEPGQLTERALLLGIIHVIGAELFAGEAERLPELAPELVQTLLMPYVGENEARRVASTA